jgi:hypothetical protein
MRRVAVCFLLLASVGCRCGGKVNQVSPSIGTSPVQVDFGPVKVGTEAKRSVRIIAQTNTQLTLSSVAVSSSSGTYRLTKPLDSVAGLSEDTIEITYKPIDYQADLGEVVIASNDPDRSEVRLPISGEGGKPILKVVPQCETAQKCTGTATVTPPSIVYAPEPYARLREIPVTELPSVAILNDGPVEMLLTKLSIEGPDAAAFIFQGNSSIPAGGLPIGAMAGVNLNIRFKPTSDTKTSYSAEVVIQADDPDKPEVRVALSGTLRPNLPPKVCANLIQVKPYQDTIIDYSGASFWTPLLVPPVGGYDFSLTRDVSPRAEAIFSAISNVTDDTACTTDPEDGRIGLTYLWSVVSTPTGAGTIAFQSPTSSQATLRPLITGEYNLTLTVKDTQNNTTVVPIKLSVALKQDLVAQLQWTGTQDVDLDIHLVRPSAVTTPSDPWSGVFSFFNQGTNGTTSGDINGYSVGRKSTTAGLDFEWGTTGTSDDPRLNLDDTGSGALVENVGLNKPENDPLCATSPCTYKVLVHYFKDGRAPPATSCSVDGGVVCKDGEVCNCTAPKRCVANEAAINTTPSGAGKCFDAPKPVVRIFLKGSPVAAATVPLDTLSPADDLAIGAPCHMLYVADVVWPAKADAGTQLDGGPGLATIVVKGADGTGRVISPLWTRFGFRQQGSLQCSPDDSARSWYTKQPE